MNILSLDLSKRSTGWAIWMEGTDAPRYGHWVLGSEYTSDGGTYVKLHQMMADLHMVMPFENLYFEEPIHPAQLGGHTNIDTLRVLAGLAAHATSFAHAYQLRSVNPINIATWRADFIGRIANSDAKARARARKQAGLKSASATPELKELVMERCRQFGFRPRRNDEADALGILDYACSVRGIIPPWREGEILRPALGGAR